MDRERERDDSAETLCKNVKDGDRIRIGYVIAKVRILPNIVRCFRCHGFGHLSYGYKVAIGGEQICRRCGVSGHSIRDCSAAQRCILCVRKGIHETKCGHIAGTAICPVYKEAIRLAGGLKLNSN